MAQPGSAHAWGAWGRRFKSCHPDKQMPDFEEVGYFIFNSSQIYLNETLKIKHQNALAKGIYLQKIRCKGII